MKNQFYGQMKVENVLFCFFPEAGVTIDRLEVKADSATYENGKINWMVCSSSTCAMLKGMLSKNTIHVLCHICSVYPSVG